MIGRSRQSIGAAEKLTEVVPQGMLRKPGMTFLQHHQTRHLQMKVRFSRWDDILATRPPAEDLPRARATTPVAGHWPRDIEEAEAALEQVRAAARDPNLATVRLEFNRSSAWCAEGRPPRRGRAGVSRGPAALPENGWSLRGLDLALRGQGRTAEADRVKAQFDKSWARADIDAPGPALRTRADR